MKEVIHEQCKLQVQVTQAKKSKYVSKKEKEKGRGTEGWANG